MLKARLDFENNHSHSATYTFFVNCGQTIKVPCFGKNQLVDMYYSTPISVYNLGIINSAHVHEGDSPPKENFHCHVFEEDDIRNGSNNIDSLIMKTV